MLDQTTKSTIMRLTLVLLLLTTSLFGSPQPAVQEAIDLYKHRADGAVGFKADKSIIDKAIAKLEASYQNTKDEETVGLYLMRSYIFKGRFASDDDNHAEKLFKKGKELGEKLIKKYPNNEEILFEQICVIGLWADKAGVMSAAMDGVLNKMKGGCEKLCELDEKHRAYAGPRILGIMYLKSPRIPFVLSWPSDEKAEELIGKSVKNAPNEFGNNFHYAEVLIELDRKAEAKKYLEKMIAMSPRPHLMLEDKAYQRDAKALLKTL